MNIKRVILLLCVANWVVFIGLSILIGALFIEKQDLQVRVANQEGVITSILRGGVFTQGWNSKDGQLWECSIFQQQNVGMSMCYSIENHLMELDTEGETREWVNITYDAFTFEQLDINYTVYAWALDEGRWVECRFYMI